MKSRGPARGARGSCGRSLGLTQRQVSGPGATNAYVSRIEAGDANPTAKALSVIAAKLGVSADYLATGAYRDPLTRLYAAATRREKEKLDDLAVRAGLLWVCGDPDCEWLNREEASDARPAGSSSIPRSGPQWRRGLMWAKRLPELGDPYAQPRMMILDFDPK